MNSTTEAIEKPKRLFEQEKNCWLSREKKVIELTELMAQCAGRIADGGVAETDEGIGRVTRLQAEIALLGRAGQQVRQSRLSAIAAAYGGMAASKREEGAELRKQALAVLAACEKHLVKLSEIQGVDYGAEIMNSQFAPRTSLHLANTNLSDLRFCSPPEIDSFSGSAALATPKSRALAVQAVALELEAAAVENQAVSMGGSLEAESILGLIDGLADPMKIGPDLEEISKWVAAVDARMAGNAGDQAETAPRRYSIAWEGGRINWNESVLRLLNSKQHLVFRAAPETVAA